MRLSELFSGVEYVTALSGDTEIVSLTADSRQAGENVLFCCIKGLTRDGHDFAPDCASKGAYILCERDLGLESQILVGSVREAFSAVCENFCSNPLRKLKLIGVTGTNGKTSTTFIAKSILDRLGYKTGLIGTIQNMIGDEVFETHFTTPDTLELHMLFKKMADAGCQYCIMEVSSHAIEQGRTAGLHFDTACFTNLTQDHLDFHGTMENYFESKKKLFSMCDRAVINTDDKWGAKLAESVGCELFTLGLGGQDFSAANENYHARGVDFTLSIKGEKVQASVPIPGKFSVYNALTAVACAFLADSDNGKADNENIVRALGEVTGVKGRAELWPTGKDFTVILDYAHTPDGVENILSSMREVSTGRLVCLVGCGGDRDPVKRPIMGETAARLADFVIVTSDNPRSENPASIIEQILPGVLKHDTEYVVIENRRDAIKYAIENARKDDVIVLAGKGHETYQILNTGTIHFDEREVLAEVFEEIYKDQ
ncbi:MAG: UDP-N-acetylmuramoyl-L-alanyl-D-glutamate--2,6-diaminopimelate ligase [Clostridia bacterium]|nr:UDP-N-acetylmuramoyl-L-alanyl-D-glutamate--2,6-diaminopimelate ligase [Clostridia bacterium]